jgi:hypothetical protein
MIASGCESYAMTPMYRLSRSRSSVTSVRSVGTSPALGCRWTSSPIFGAERHAGSSSEPSIAIGADVAVTAADLITRSVEAGSCD